MVEVLRDPPGFMPSVAIVGAGQGPPQEGGSAKQRRFMKPKFVVIRASSFHSLNFKTD